MKEVEGEIRRIRSRSRREGRGIKEENDAG
jgi:hypothetical protein